MDDAITETIGRVFCEVLEKQAFMFADPAAPEEFDGADGDYLSASMGFRGEIEGNIALAVPKSLLPEIASNFLGMDAADPFVTARASDACKELLNVTCGHMLTALRGEAPVFDLSIPRLSDVDPGLLAAWARKPGTLRFSVEGSPLLLMVGFGGGDGGHGRDEAGPAAADAGRAG